MTRVKLDIRDDEHGYVATEEKGGEYSLSQEEYADYLAACEKYEDWQDKLHVLKPDNYVPPPPPTEEELRRREANYALFEYQHTEAYLDKIAPIPNGAA